MPPPTSKPPTSQHSSSKHRSKHPTTLSRTSTASSISHTPSTASIDWHHLPNSVLSTYRHAYSLDLPPAFLSTHNAAVLGTSSIGGQSPTMLKARAQYGTTNPNASGLAGGIGLTTKPKGKKRDGRISKDQLATAVRRHFNGQAVNETEVMSEMGYKCQVGGNKFRAPPRKR